MAQKIIYQEVNKTISAACLVPDPPKIKTTSPGQIYNQINIINETIPEKKIEEPIKIEANESDLCEYLSDPDNILIAYGQKIAGHSRSEVLSLCNNLANIYVDEHKNKYVQIAGRHLIQFKDLHVFHDFDFSIFNISTLLNVILVTNMSTGARQKRSYYELKFYSKEDFERIHGKLE